MKELKGRLTYHEKNGDFGVAGMNETNQDEKLYACICKLKDYEDLGFNPSELEILLRLYDEMVEQQDKLESTIARYKHSNQLLEKELKSYRMQSNAWVPVSENLPDKNVRVLVACQTKKGFRSHNLAYYVDGHWHGTGSMSGVTHWRELPVLPIE